MIKFSNWEHTENTQKGDKGYTTNRKMYTFLEQNIRVFLGLHKLIHRSTFGKIYFFKNITILHKWITKHIVQPLQCSPI